MSSRQVHVQAPDRAEAFGLPRLHDAAGEVPGVPQSWAGPGTGDVPAYLPPPQGTGIPLCRLSGQRLNYFIKLGFLYHDIQSTLQKIQFILNIQILYLS